MNNIKVCGILVAITAIWFGSGYLLKWQEESDWRESARAAIASQFTDAGQWEGLTCNLQLTYSANGMLMFVGSDDPDAAFCDLASTAGIRAADKHLIPLPPARMRNYAKDEPQYTEVKFYL